MTDPYATPPPSFDPRPHANAPGVDDSHVPASPAASPSPIPGPTAPGPGRLDGVRTGVASARWRVGRISRGDPLQSVIVVWLLFLAVAAVYALIRPVIRSLFYDIGILMSLLDLLDLLSSSSRPSGAIAAIVCTIVLAVRTVREEMPASSPPPALPGTRSVGGTTRGRTP